MDYKKMLREGLKANGFKCTPARMLVFLKLIESEALTDSMLANSLAKSVDRSTVYRTIELFSKLGLITRIWNGWKSTIELSGMFIEHHHHLSCVKCGKVERLESKPLEKVLTQIEKDSDFSNLSHILEFRGLCKECT